MDLWKNLALQYIGSSEGTNVLLLLALTALGVFLYHRRSTESHGQHMPESTSNIKAPKMNDRGLGEWIPLKFTYPAFDPSLQPLTDIIPAPRIPFKHGPHHVTMGIRSMPWEKWIELDNRYEDYYRIRKHRIGTRGDKVIRVLRDDSNPEIVKGGGVAAIELVHELAEYLSRRYPTTFRVVSRHDMGRSADQASLSPQSMEEFCDWGWEGAPPIKSIHVEPTNETFELPLHLNDGERAPERALEIAALLVQDDLAIMIEGNDGKYYFQAGAILVAGFWRLEDKIGMPLEEIHTSGNVPQYREKLQASMARFFRRLAVDKPVERSNLFIQVVKPAGERDELDPEELAWSESTNGPEDDFTLAHEFAGERRAPTAEQIQVRTERQTLRRLGVSGGIVFTIRTYLVPVTGLGEAGGRLGATLAGWPADVRGYKGVSRGGWWGVLEGYLSPNRGKQ